MKSYRLSRAAVADLREASGYIARDSKSAAVRWLDSIEHKFTVLSTQPEIGERCDGVRPGLRRFSAGSYVIYYRIDAGKVRIIRVLHGARDSQRLL